MGDATYARALAEFGEEGIVDMVGLSGYYTLIAMVLNTARTPLRPDATPALEPFFALTGERRWGQRAVG